MHITLVHFQQVPNPVYGEIASALRRRGHTVWLTIVDPDGNLEWHDGERIVAVLPGPEKGFRRRRRTRMASAIWRRISLLAFVLRVRGFLRQIRPDIVQVNTGSYPWLLPLLMPEDMRFVFDVRQINEKARGEFIGRAKEWQLAWTMTACARFFYDHTCFCHVEAARRILGQNWSRWSTVIPVGVNPRFLELTGPGSNPRDDGHRVRFVYVGTLSKLRTLEVLLLAAQQVQRETSEFELDLIGPDAAQGFYHELVSSLQLGPAVQIKPAVDYEAIPDVLASYDVGVAYVPVRPTWDYQPAIKVLEYLALGLPILSTDVASHREVVEDGVNGLLVQDTVESLAMGMQRFVLDRGFLHRCQANAKRMRRGMTWDEVAERYEQDVYRRLER